MGLTKLSGSPNSAARPSWVSAGALSPTLRIWASSSSTPGQAGAGHRLVGGHDDGLEPGFVGQRLQHRHGDHGRAVGVGDDADGEVVEGVGVDLGDDERHAVVHAERRRVVDDDGTGRGDAARPAPSTRWRRPRRGRRRGRSSRPSVGVLDGDLGVTPGQGAAGRTGRGEVPQLVDGEVAFCQEASHDAAHLAGCSEDSYAHGHTGYGRRHRRFPCRLVSVDVEVERGVEQLDGLLDLRLLDDAARCGWPRSRSSRC